MRFLNTIGIVGQKQNGKDTLCEYLLKKFPHMRRYSFADEVKKIFSETFDFSLPLIEEWKVRQDIPVGFDSTVREGLMLIGDGFRRIMNDVWIKKVLNNTSDIYKIISDVRYFNEMEKIKERNGINVLVCNPSRLNNVDNKSESEMRPYIEWCLSIGREGVISSWPEYHAVCRDPNFISSQDGLCFVKNLSNIDFFILNDSLKEDFYKKVDDILVPYIFKVEESHSSISSSAKKLGSST